MTNTKLRQFTVSIPFALFLFQSFSSEAQNLPPKLQNEIKEISKWATDDILITAARNQNKENATEEQILQRDREWTGGKIPESFVKSLMSNACADRLRALQKDVPSAMESFVMDAKGAIVCMTQKTSDYWQGDEPKWKDAFHSGQADPVVGKKHYDESSKSTLVHISVPILYQNKAIGVLCTGINLIKLAAE